MNELMKWELIGQTAPVFGLAVLWQWEPRYKGIALMLGPFIVGVARDC